MGRHECSRHKRRRSSDSGEDRQRRKHRRKHHRHHRSDRSSSRHVKEEKSDSPEKPTDELELSVEETNALRLKLGLAPLDDEPAKSETKDVHVPAESMRSIMKTEKLREKIALKREFRSFTEKLAANVQLFADDEDEMVEDWIGRIGTRKVEPKVDDIPSSEKADYNDESVLKGLGVGHEKEAFPTGRTVILTLKDVRVLEDEEDLLENAEMVDDDRAKKAIEAKKKVGYNRYELAAKESAGILAKYDDDDDEEPNGKGKAFRIGDDGGICGEEQNRPGGQSLSTEITIAKDYLTEEEAIRFRKRPRKIKKWKKEGVDDGGTEVWKGEKADFVVRENEDDDEVSKKLRIAKTRKKLDLEMVKRQTIDNDDGDDDDYDPCGLVLNSTNEFCKRIGAEGVGQRDEFVAKRIVDNETEKVVEQFGVPSITTKDNSVLDEEPLLHSGISAALQLVRTKGYLDGEKNRQNAKVGRTILSSNYTIDDRKSAYDIDDKLSRKMHGSGHNGPLQEFKERPNYTPNVTLEYLGENGRKMNEKEAFRYLSHRFHGKGSGKKKTEKRLSKFKEEDSMMRMTSTDTPLNTVTLLQEKQKQLNVPYIVLSAVKKDPKSG